MGYVGINTVFWKIPLRIILLKIVWMEALMIYAQNGWGFFEELITITYDNEALLVT